MSEQFDMKSYYLSDIQLTGNMMEFGTYSSSLEITIPVRGVVKKIHDNVFMQNENLTEDFAAELKILTTLHHSNILQFLGICNLKGSRVPAIVMERMLTNLHDLLDPGINPYDSTELLADNKFPRFELSLSVKFSLLQDIAFGINYLHERSPPIIHSELSGKNVFLSTSLVAKIGDFIQSRIISNERVTCTSDSLVYMPPEVTTPFVDERKEKPVLKPSVDVFSFGVISIFTLGEKFPEHLLPSLYVEKDNVFPIVRNELQRRKAYMSNVNDALKDCNLSYEDHPFIQMIKQCLRNFPADRPSAHELLHLLKLAKDQISYDDCNVHKEKQFLVKKILESQTEPKHQNMEHVFQSLISKNAELQHKLEASEKKSATVQPKKKCTPHHEDQKLKTCERKQKLSVQCLNKANAPCVMVRGSVTSDESCTYIVSYGSNIVYRYQWNNEKWAKLFPCPYLDSSIILIKKSLIALGGNDVFQTAGKKLFSIKKTDWVAEYYPEMSEARSDAAVVCTPSSDYIIVIGGLKNGGRMTRVDLLHTGSKTWYELADLPHSLTLPSATLCGDTLYVIGCDGDGYTCSLKSLPANADSETIILRDIITWTPLPHLPVKASTASTLCEKLLIIGGMTDDGTSVDSIHQLIDKQWVLIGTMTTERRMCLVVNVASDRLIIVGGWRGFGALDSIEECCCVGWADKNLLK